MNVDPIVSRLATAGVSFAPEIAGAARRHGLDPQLLAAVAAQETGGPDTNAGHNIVGDGGHGHGLFQIDDRWHPFASTPAALDPAKNADYAAGMLSGLIKQYGGNVHEALSAYNTGSPRAPGTKTRWSDGSDLPYADSVLRHYGRLSGRETVTGNAPAISGSGVLTAGSAGSPESSAAAEIATLISSLGALSAQAQSLPLPPPNLPSPSQHQHYHPQATDYTQFADDSN
jgi:Transglycosylase SLT domain